ncbi:hypothetical protein C900_02795 [Fulvivirga imtechensis AK7]|uniref:Polysaccharide chain length determinant N-terminal domain-containing protein n=1 Tax=Fulvivirga imtechensis AK7 TaxID=1237149 RepID=L8JV44_9BACT|nr:Wzz/FepE/Etk N-terminal domain-containing protein [Fulvivirga imtechensis]ELR71454.1 hypothetical protein C900_02795 [Fulvivirga imtechensis AK7]
MAEKYNDEIDLTELFIKGKNILFRNKLLITSFFIGGILLGFLYYKLKPSVYQSEVVIRSGILNESLLSVINENLNKLIEEDNNEALSSKLNISSELSQQVLSIEIESTEEDDEEESSYYVVTIKSLVNHRWPELQTGMIHYLSANQFVKKRIDIREERFKNYIAKLDQEIKEIDSLKLSLGSAEKYGNDNVIVMNPSDVYATLVRLYQQRQEYKESLEFNEAVEVVENFDAYQRPVSPRPVFSMGVGGLIGLILALFVAFGKELNRYMRRYEETHPTEG